MSKSAVSRGLSIVPVTSRQSLRRFVELPYAIYRNDPYFVPPLRRDEYKRFDPASSAFLAHASIRLWLAERDGRTVGRIAGIHDDLHDAAHREHTGFFGFFEAEDTGVAVALLRAVEAWARAHGYDRVRGPVNASMNETAGLLVDGFESVPYLLMPYNPPSYGGYIEAAGYAKAKDLLAWDIDLTAPLPDRLARLAERVRNRADVAIRTLDMRWFSEDLEVLKQIYCSAWQDNWGFVPLTNAEINQMAAELKAIVDPEFVLFAEIDGKPVGVALSLPDLNQVLQRMNGRLTPLSLWHFLRRRRIVNRGRMLLLGVEPQARRLGLYPLLLAETHRRALPRGYVRAEVGWTLEDNDLINAGIAAAGARPYKRYRLYEKPLR